MSRTYTPITPELADYIRLTTVREPEALRRQREATEEHPNAGLQISPEQGQFLHVMARLVGARRTIEIGVFLGYSSAWVALALPPGGKLIGCDVNPEYAAIARRTWEAAGVADRVELRLAPAMETLDKLLGEGHAGSFDMAFIDADKSSYLDYYERALALVRAGGLIVADNVLWDGRVADESDQEKDTVALRAFNCKLQSDPRVASVLATVGDGFALACKL